MANLKYKDIQKMSKKDRERKLKDLKMELIKSKATASKTGSSKGKEIRKIIARILTFNTSENNKFSEPKKQKSDKVFDNKTKVLNKK